jgi:hypothetical protein
MMFNVLKYDCDVIGFFIGCSFFIQRARNPMTD